MAHDTTRLTRPQHAREGGRWPERWWWLPLIAAVSVLLVYHRALGFDLLCDDWLVLRPWSARELLSTWHGTWEPQNTWVVFYRPIAAVLYAVLFDLFGVNAHALMAVSIAWLVALAWMLGVFVRRETRSGWIAAAAIVIYAVHPNGPWSAGVWLTNDFHKLALMVTLAALLNWQRCRSRPEAGWWPLGVLAALAFLIKEDGLMLIPALLALQAGRARWIGDVPPPSRRLVAAGVLLGAALVAWRHESLGALGGFDWPQSAWPAVANLLRGPYYVLTGKASLDTEHYGARLLVSGAALAAVAVVVWRMRRDRQWLAVAGLIVIACFDAPLLLVSGPTRYYALTAGASLFFAGVAADLWPRAPRAAARIGFVLGAGVLLATAALGAADSLDRQAPCAAPARDCVDWTVDQPLLPPELRAYTFELARDCRTGQRRPAIDALGTLTWGLAGFPEFEAGAATPFSWTSDTVIAFVERNAVEARLRVRHPDAGPLNPIALVVVADGATPLTVRLSSPQWTDIRVPLASGLRVWLRAKYRLDIRIAAPDGFRPGVQLEQIQAR